MGDVLLFNDKYSGEKKAVFVKFSALNGTLTPAFRISVISTRSFVYTLV